MSGVLVIYKEFPAATVRHAGGQAVYRVIQALAQRGDEVSLVARLRREEEPLVADTAALCKRLYLAPHHTALPGPRPLAFVRSYLALRRQAALALRQVRPDLVHVEVTQTAVAILGLPRPCSSFRPLDVNWFLLQQQADATHGLRRGLLRVASRLLKRIEPWLCRRHDLVTAISEGDRRLLAGQGVERPLFILPLSPSFEMDEQTQPAVPPGPNVLFVGAMYRALNVQGVLWFLDQVWPRVRARLPEARFYVVGYAPPPEVMARHDGQNVFVVGFADDLAAWYKAAAVCVSPIRVAGGLLQKVIDALAAGVPVVATSVSNHGVGGVPGEHLRVADEPDDFAAAVCDLVQDPLAAQRLAQAGRQFVRERYDLPAAIEKWEAAWRNMIGAVHP